MWRRATGVLMLVFVLASSASAQTLSGPTLWMQSVARDTCAEAGVYRTFESSENSFARMISGHPSTVYTGAIAYDSAADASLLIEQARQQFDTYLSWLDVETVPDSRGMSIPDLGDEAVAFTAVFEPGNDDGVTLYLTLSATRHDSTVLLLMTWGTNTAGTLHVEWIEATLDRLIPTQIATPVSEAITGDMVGGLYDALPRTQEMPTGFILQTQGLLPLQGVASSARCS